MRDVLTKPLTQANIEIYIDDVEDQETNGCALFRVPSLFHEDNCAINVSRVAFLRSRIHNGTFAPMVSAVPSVTSDAANCHRIAAIARDDRLFEHAKPPLCGHRKANWVCHGSIGPGTRRWQSVYCAPNTRASSSPSTPCRQPRRLSGYSPHAHYPSSPTLPRKPNHL